MSRSHRSLLCIELDRSTKYSITLDYPERASCLSADTCRFHFATENPFTDKEGSQNTIVEFCLLRISLDRYSQISFSNRNSMKMGCWEVPGRAFVSSQTKLGIDNLTWALVELLSSVKLHGLGNGSCSIFINQRCSCSFSMCSPLLREPCLPFCHRTCGLFTHVS